MNGFPPVFWVLVTIWAILIIAAFWTAHKPEPGLDIDDESDRGGHVRIVRGDADGE